MTFSEFQSIAELAAREAGAALRAGQQQDPGVISAEGRDIKTRADQEAEAHILRILAKTGIPVLAEESGLHRSDPSKTVREHLSSPGKLWIVDPLDGTYNYTRGMPWTCVSIGLWENGAAAMGVIYDFTADEMWVGLPGQGATCNGQPVHVSGTKTRNQAVLCTGFPSARDMGDEALRVSLEEMQTYKKIRMIGSAALAMVFVARGWADVYREEQTWIWDIAAGAALIEAAGGQVTMTNLQDNGQLDIRATNNMC